MLRPVSLVCFISEFKSTFILLLLSVSSYFSHHCGLFEEHQAFCPRLFSASFAIFVQYSGAVSLK